MGSLRLCLRRRALALCMLALAGFVSTTQSLASDCHILDDAGGTDLPGALFVVAANVGAERNSILANKDLKPLEFDLPGNTSAISVGNAFLVATYGNNMGLVLTAKHVVMEICSGTLGNSNRGVFLAWPGPSSSPKVLIQAHSPPGFGVQCSASADEPSPGADLAFLAIDLSKFSTGMSRFRALPIASQQWDEIQHGHVFQSFTVEGWEPAKHFQRITGSRTTAHSYTDDSGHQFDGVFVVGTAFEPGYSGSAILGYTASGEYAVVGAATNVYPDWGAQNASVSLDYVSELIDDKLRWDITYADKGLGIDLRYIEHIVPGMPTDSFVKDVLAISDTSMSQDNRDALTETMTNLSVSFDQAQLVGLYAASRTREGASLSAKLLFDEAMAQAEAQWCWDTQAFQEYFQHDAEQVTSTGVISYRDLGTTGENLLAASNSHAPKSKLDLARLQLAFTELEVATGGDASLPQALSNQFSKDRVTAAVRLAKADPNARTLSILDSQVPANGPLDLNMLGLQKAAADARVVAARSTSNSQTRSNLLHTAAIQYQSIISSNRATPGLTAASVQSLGLTHSLSRQLLH